MSPRRGFSLIEVIVAVTLLGVVAATHALVSARYTVRARSLGRLALLARHGQLLAQQRGAGVPGVFAPDVPALRRLGLPHIPVAVGAAAQGVLDHRRREQLLAVLLGVPAQDVIKLHVNLHRSGK